MNVATLPPSLGHHDVPKFGPIFRRGLTLFCVIVLFLTVAGTIFFYFTDYTDLASAKSEAARDLRALQDGAVGDSPAEQTAIEAARTRQTEAGAGLTRANWRLLGFGLVLLIPIYVLAIQMRRVEDRPHRDPHGDNDDDPRRRDPAGGAGTRGEVRPWPGNARHC